MTAVAKSLVYQVGIPFALNIGTHPNSAEIPSSVSVSTKTKEQRIAPAFEFILCLTFASVSGTWLFSGENPTLLFPVCTRDTQAEEPVWKMNCSIALIFLTSQVIVPRLVVERSKPSKSHIN